MNCAKRFATRLSFTVVLIALAIFSLTLSVPLFAQELIPADKVLPTAVNSASAETVALTPEQIAQQRERFQQQMQDLWAKGLTVSVTDDASHRAIVYSNPGPEAEAIRKGTHREWLQRVNDPGYLMQQLRRREPAAGPEGFYWLARLQQELARGSGQAQRQVLPAYGPETVPAASSETRDWNISLGAAGVAPAQYAAKFDYNGGYPSCTLDYAVFPVDAAGSSTQAMLVGVNNLYDFCTGTRPAVKFAYYYSTGGTVKTSPTISNDGTKIVFLESRTNASILHILTLGTTGSNGASAVNPVLPGTGNNASDFGIELSGGVSVTRSFPYYDFNSDSVYVGDDVGKLHYITPVFCPGATTCSPAEVTAGGWPVTVHSGAVLSAPIHDPVSLNAFVGDSSGNAYYVRTTGSTTGTCAAGGIPCVGTPTVTVGAGGNYGGLVDTPLADIFAGMVWFATGQSVAGTCTTSGAPVVLQVTTALAPEAAACLGIGGVNNVHLGGFDYAYYNSPVSGHLWWAGNDATYGVPALWAMNFNASNVMITPVEKGAISSAAVDASPLTESYDGWTGKDWLSFSVPANSCGGTGATGGCLATYSLVPGVSPASELPWLPSWGYASGAEIIDTNGNVQKASGLGTPLGPTGATPPVWSAVTGNMVTEGTNADATGTGTFTANTAVGGQYVTVDGVTLTAATPKAATTIGTFTADPSPLTAAISITAASGSPTVNFTPANSTGASATGTFTADPTSGSVTITQPSASSVCTAPPCAMTLAVSPGAAATGTGTFTGAPSSGVVTITNGANVMTLNASAGVAASGTGTFASPDPQSGNVTITNGANVETLTVSPNTAATDTGTFTTQPASGSTVTLTNGVHSAVITASLAAKASGTATFTGTTTAGNTVTITNGGNALVMTAGLPSATATGPFSIAGVETCAHSSVYVATAYSVIGDRYYYFWSSVNQAGGYNCGTTYPWSTYYDYTAYNSPVTNVLIGTTAAQTAANLAAAISGAAQSSCGYSLTAGGSAICYWTNSTPVANTYVSAAASGATVTLTSTVAGTAGNGTGSCYQNYGAITANTTNYPDWSTTADICDAGGVNGVTNACASSTAGTFQNNASTTTEASNFAAALALCPAGTGVTASSASNVTTITALAAGAGGNSIDLATNASTVTLSGSTLSGGTGSPTSATTYAMDGVLADDATQLAAAINLNTSGTIPFSATSSGAAVTVTDTATPRGTVQNGVLGVSTTSAGGTFAWASPTLGGAVNGTTSATMFATDGVLNDDATNLVTAINDNTGVNYPVSAVNSGGGVVTLTDTTFGSTGNSIALSKTISSGFTWSGASLTGGSGLNTGNYFATSAASTSGNAANLAAAITRNTSVNVPVTAANNGTSVVTVTATSRGTAGNSIQLETLTGAYATSTVGWTAQPSSELCNADYPGIVIGDEPAQLNGNIFYFEAGSGSVCGTGTGYCCTNTNYSTQYAAGAEIVLIGATLTQTAQNLAAAINLSPMSACGSTQASGSGAGTCYQFAAANPAVCCTAVANGNTVVLTSKTAGTAGNGTAGECYETYGFEGYDTYLGNTNYENLSPTGACNAGGVNTAVANLTGFGWNPTNPVDLSGGASGVTSATSFATDGVLADDATNLAAAIGLGNTANNVGVAATAAASAVLVTANPRGTVGNSIVVGPATQPATLTWSCGTTPCDLSGGANGVTTATTYAINGVTSYDASQLVASINNAANAALGVTATQGAGTCGVTAIAANQFCLAATVPGSTGNSITVGSGSAAVTATGNFHFTAQPADYEINADFPGIEVGGKLWFFIGQSGSVCTGGCSGDYSALYGDNEILIGDTVADTAANVAAAISNNQALCGYKLPSGTGAGTCFGEAQAQTYVTATANSPTSGYLYLTADVTGTGGNCAGTCYTTYGWETYDAIEADPDEENITPTSGGLSGGVNSSTVANYTWNPTPHPTGGADGTTTGTTFQVWSGAAELSAANIATNFATAVRLNGTLNPLMTATTPSVTSPVVTLQARVCGLQGDYALGAGNLSGFNWSGPTMTGGACTITWTNQGAGNGQTAMAKTGGTSGIIGDSVAYPAWQASHVYQVNSMITDSNGNVQKVTVPGTSGASSPTWNATQGGTTHDGTVTWTNQGMEPTSNLNFSSGATGYQLSQPALQ